MSDVKTPSAPGTPNYRKALSEDCGTSPGFSERVGIYAKDIAEEARYGLPAGGVIGGSIGGVVGLFGGVIGLN